MPPLCIHVPTTRCFLSAWFFFLAWSSAVTTSQQSCWRTVTPCTLRFCNMPVTFELQSLPSVFCRLLHLSSWRPTIPRFGASPTVDAAHLSSGVRERKTPIPVIGDAQILHIMAAIWRNLCMLKAYKRSLSPFRKRWLFGQTLSSAQNKTAPTLTCTSPAHVALIAVVYNCNVHAPFSGWAPGDKISTTSIRNDIWLG